MAATLEEIKTREREILARMKELDAAAKAESRDFTDEEQVEFDALDKELDELAVEKKALDERQKKTAATRLKITEREKALSPPGPGRRMTIGGGGVTPAERPRVTVVNHDYAADEGFGFRSPREFLVAVMQARPDANRMDDRLRPLWQAAAGSDEQQGGTDAYGGFLVPSTMLPQVFMIPAEVDPFAGRVTQIPMATPSVEISARVDKNHTSSVSGGFTVTRKAETVAATSSRSEFEQILYKATKQVGLAYVTEELLTDSPISFASIVQRGFSDEFAAATLSERLTGTGAGEFLGILKSPCLVSVAKEGGQAADTIVKANLVKMRARCWRYGSPGTFWLANHDTIPQLADLNTGTGGVQLWLPSLREDVPDLLLGKPIFFSEFAETLGDQGDIIICNAGEYLEGEYQPLQSADSTHVRFVEHERAFKLWRRNAGAPWWRSALTPKKGASTLSPFVTLDART